MAYKCLLDKQENCNYNCKHCGWNKEEAKNRKALLAEKGLTSCKDGLERLILHSTESEAFNG